MPLSPCRALVLILVFAPCLAADVLVVAADGSGDFTYPSAAVSAAASGDTILFRAGSYGAVPLFDGKSLNLVAEPGASVELNGIAISGLAADRHVSIAGIKSSAEAAGSAALDIRGCQGAIRVADGSFTGSSGFYGGLPGSVGFAGVYVESSGDVALVRCEIVGGQGESGALGTSPDWEPCPPSASSWYRGGAGLELWNASATLHQCTLAGGAGGDGILCGYSGPGGPAIHATASSAFLAGCDLGGGTGGFVDPCECGGDGGTALVLDGALLDLLEVTLTPGGPAAGSASSTVGPPPVLTGGAAMAVLPGKARELVASGALTAGQPLLVDVNGELGDAAFLAASTMAGTFDILGLTGPLLLTPPFFVSGAPLGTIGAGGQVSASFPTPTLPVGVEGATIFLQALLVDAGGAFVLTGSNAVTLITSSILP